MKKSVIICFVLCLSLALSGFLTACGSKKPDSGESENTSISQSQGESEVSENSSPPEINRGWPFVTGSFIQLWAFSSYTENKWQKHFDYLKEAGIDTVIIQATCSSVGGKATSSYFPLSGEIPKTQGYTQQNLIEPILKVCAEKGIKVFLGLNNPEEWFSKVFTVWDWCVSEGAFGVSAARELYGLYKEKYPDTLYGWYFVPEYYNGIGTPDKAADFLNIYLDGLTAINPSMPLMLSPFLRSFVSPEETRDEWAQIFSASRFRPGDIFCCQDSVGGGGIILNHLDGYFKALKEAVDTKPGLAFWANNEDFTSTAKPAPLDRFVKQMEIASEYVEGFVTFAYSHYYSPDKVNPAIHAAYVNYYNTGEYEKPASSQRQDEYTGAKTLLSLGRDYTGLPNTRGDGFDDNGTKLTDGVILSPDGNDARYAGTSSDKGGDIIIDLGVETQNICEFSLFNTYGSWGINPVESVTYYVSDDKKSWTKIGTVESYDLEPVEVLGSWLLLDFKFVPLNPVSGRYVKFEVANTGFIWISEACVYSYDE
ncbi:MAG: DUF4434 domain-containing protein [Eubacteriales bacterium]